MCGHEIDGQKDEPCPYCRITELEAEIERLNSPVLKYEWQKMEAENKALREAVEAIEKERGIHRYYKPMDIAIDTAAALLKAGE
jgi:hypothetical protein